MVDNLIAVTFRTEGRPGKRLGYSVRRHPSIEAAKAYAEAHACEWGTTRSWPLGQSVHVRATSPERNVENGM